jgi:uncharacterized protein (TIGR02284 family)
MSSDLKQLNLLISLTLNRAEDYKAAGLEAEQESVASLLFDRANECEDVVLVLQTRIRELGQEPDFDDDTANEASRFRVSLSEAVHGGPADAVMHLIQAMEQTMRAAFDKVEQDSDLSAQSRQTVRECRKMVHEARLGKIQKELEAAARQMTSGGTLPSAHTTA